MLNTQQHELSAEGRMLANVSAGDAWHLAVFTQLHCARQSPAMQKEHAGSVAVYTPSGPA